MRNLLPVRSFIPIFLLFISSAALVSGVQAGVTGIEDAAFLFIGALGVLLSFLFGAAKTSARGSWAWIFLCGLAAVFVEAARLRGPLLELVKVFPQFEIQFLLSRLNKEAVDTSALQAQFAEIVLHSRQYLSNLLSGDDTRPAVLETVWGLIIYFLSAWSGWWSSRRNAILAALAPSFALHGFILYYTNADLLSLQVAMFALISLLGTGQQWNTLQNTGDGLERARRETYSTIMVISITLAVAAGFIPPISIKHEDQKALENAFAKSLGLDREIAKRYSVPSLPNQHLVGLDPSTSQAVVFTVKTGELPVTDKPITTGSVPHHYWRWLTYDQYNGQGWSTSPVASDAYPAHHTLFAPQGLQHKVIHQQVEKNSPQDQRLYWTGTLLSASQPFESTWRTSPQSLGAGLDPLLISDMLGSLTGEQAYTADSIMPIVSERTLRASPLTYPPAIRDRYLSLPEGVTERTVRLAEDITQGFDNPYDKAKAIEAYLRTYPYTLDVPPPPQNQDVADYFLFELQMGYCDYYATAMAVMGRVVGLPTRLVIGYSSGDYDPAQGEYIVREQNAHSWVEVYFTGTGWVEFEPTASQPIIPLPADPAEELSAAPLRPVVIHSHNTYIKKRFAVNENLPPIIPIVLTTLITTACWILYREGLLRIHPSVGSIYGFVFRHGRRIRRNAARHETPSLFAEKIKEILATNHSWLRPGVNELDYLTTLYLREIYSAHPVTKDERKQAVKVWAKLFWRLLLTRVLPH